MALYFYIAVFALFAVPAAWLELADNGWCSWRGGRGRATAGDAVDSLSAETPGGMSPSYLAFRRNYVLVFSLMMGGCVSLRARRRRRRAHSHTPTTTPQIRTTHDAGDWLQGPYVYRLYEHYDYGVRDIGRLFIMGFASSAVFGTVAGALADK